MPVYVYKNLNTGETFEVEQRITEDALTAHPESGDPVKRLIQPVGIAFKGSGFYVNDSRSSGAEKGVSKGASGSGAEGGSGAGSGGTSGGSDGGASGSGSDAGSGSAAASGGTSGGKDAPKASSGAGKKD